MNGVMLTEKNVCYHMSSFNESVALGCLKQAPVEFVKYPCCWLSSNFVKKRTF